MPGQGNYFRQVSKFGILETVEDGIADRDAHAGSFNEVVTDHLQNNYNFRPNKPKKNHFNFKRNHNPILNFEPV